MASHTVSEIKTIVRPFVEICLLRRGPQDLPDSTFLLVLVLMSYTVMSIILNTVILDVWNSLLAGVTDTILISILTGSVLYLHGLKARIIQTLSAMAGTGTIFSLVAVPLFSWRYGGQQNGPGDPIAFLLVLGLFLWSLTVTAHILRHALSVPFVLGILIAAAFAGISYTVFSNLFFVGA